MDWLIVSSSPALGAQWLAALENLDEAWRCRCAQTAPAAAELLRRQAWDACLLCADLQGIETARLLAAHPPLAAPWVAAEFPHPCVDMPVHPGALTALPQHLAALRRMQCLPRLAPLRHGQVTCLARGLMHALEIPPHLKACAFLPDMAALTVVHPPLLSRLQGTLYPLVGRRHGMSPGAVERSMRLMIEATWKVGSLPALERFFGHSVDPERGKPTNREFLFRLQERLTLAALRVQKSPLSQGAGGLNGFAYSAGASSAGTSSSAASSIVSIAAWASSE